MEAWYFTVLCLGSAPAPPPPQKKEKASKLPTLSSLLSTAAHLHRIPITHSLCPPPPPPEALTLPHRRYLAAMCFRFYTSFVSSRSADGIPAPHATCLILSFLFFCGSISLLVWFCLAFHAIPHRFWPKRRRKNTPNMMEEEIDGIRHP